MSLGVDGDNLNVYLDYIAREDAAYVTGNNYLEVRCEHEKYLRIHKRVGCMILRMDLEAHCSVTGLTYLRTNA